MPFSHHSHSGQFCGHASNTLEDVVRDAVLKGMSTFCLTEHIGRDEIDFYPEEKDHHTEESLAKLYDDFYSHARELQTKYAPQIQLWVGAESEWIRPSSLDIIEDLLRRHTLDLFVGSVHHVHTYPIDYDDTLYRKARDAAGGTDEGLYEDYFDAQYEMLRALRPPVVGHFDLIRLKSDEPGRSFQSYSNVWTKVIRNLTFIAEYGGVLELNSSSFRKGLDEAYPEVAICKAFKDVTGRFTLSDDSHGIAHVGLNYHRVWECVQRAGVTELYCLAPVSSTVKSQDSRFPRVGWVRHQVSDLNTHRFWNS